MGQLQFKNLTSHSKKAAKDWIYRMADLVLWASAHAVTPLTRTGMTLWSCYSARAKKGCRAHCARSALLWSLASEQPPTVPATDPTSSVKMLLGSVQSRGVGVRPDV